MNNFVFQNTFTNMFIFNKYFCKNKKSKLYFENRVAVLNAFIYQTGGSTFIFLILLAKKKLDKFRHN
jgi:hypothetical protein